jgi:small subunit ribosomal protein S30e
MIVTCRCLLCHSETKKIDISMIFMAHGGLAQAGKVKGVTPKVEKGEKRKRPKGRANMRIKYKRRFMSGGDGKHPNRNSDKKK